MIYRGTEEHYPTEKNQAVLECRNEKIDIFYIEE